MTGFWPADGIWLRCALHAHTTKSDGELPPDGLAQHYERAGYDVLAITDHWARTDAEPIGDLLVIPSVELNCVLPEARDGHVLGLGISCELEVGRGLSSVHWDELLEAGRLCPAIATDDSHHPGFDSDRALTWVHATERSAAAVLGALTAGSFYSTCGPAIHDILRDGDAIEVGCSPCRAVTLVAGKSKGAAVNAGRLGYRHGGTVLSTDDGGAITAARLTIPAAATHVRVEVTDTSGKKAWANPIVL